MKKKIVCIMAGMMMLTVILSGCGQGSSKDSGKAGGAAGAGDNSVDVEIGPSPETIDPALNTTVDGGNMIFHAFEGLLKTDRNDNIIPGQAESYEVSSDGLTWTFKLRDGLKWSDGTPLTAEDFVYSWRRIADPATAAPYGYDLLNNIKGFDEASEGDLDALAVSAPDEGTFVVELSTPCVYFDKICAFGVMVPVQKAAVEAKGEAWATDPDSYITNGPYYMTEYTDGAQIVFTKNPYYWDAGNITFDTITWHLIEDANAAYSAYQNGDLDMINDVPSEEIPSLEGNEEFHVEPVMGTYYLSFNIEKEPFNDPKVREALSLAIDREYVAGTIMQGTYSPAKNFIGPGLSDAEEGSSFEEETTREYGDHFDISDHESDLQKAKKLLAEAGYPGGAGFPEFSYLINDADYHRPLAEYLQSAWAELGLTVTIDIEEWKTMSADRRAGNFEVVRNGWACDWDDPSNMLDTLETENGNNDGKYSNPDFDKAVKEARMTTDIKEHYRKLHEAEQIALNDAAMAPVAYYNDFYLQKTYLKNTWHSPYGYWFFMYGSKEK